MVTQRTVAIVGAGPVGLAAAAHVLERGMKPIVLEAGENVAHAMRQWGHVQMFSPWEYNIDRAAERLLRPTGWNSPAPQQYPTGAELVERYLEPLATKTALAGHIKTSSRVTDISRVGFDKLKSQGRENAPFEIRYRNGKGPEVLRADAVIDVSGTWHSPNPAGANGLPAIGERAAAGRIAYGMPDVLGKERARYAGKTVAVLGAGHSAIGTLIDLARLAEREPATRPLWLLRGSDPAKAFGGGANDKLAARGELGSAFARLVADGRIRLEREFRVSHIALDGSRLIVGADAGERQLTIDELIVATGFRPDFDFLRELRIELDPVVESPVPLAPLIDPNLHSCGTVRPHGARELAQPEPGFYFAGMKSYGRAPTFLMLTGYEQVRSIAADIAGDREAAGRVELMLPETGVCSRAAAPSANACCGGPAPAQVDACCADDAKAKQQGKAGCGCG
ncbi:MAG: NAD(P)-binding domain-containing protein [Bradyrhizobium sp.]|uniref:NAD(P)-binding domain-containing protein n=1 Tax=Bradyrhizobium sp. TaxID=376 RepID=UPI003D0ACDF2